MSSPEFQKLIGLLRDAAEPGAPLDIDVMRRRLDRVGGRLPDGVTAEPATVGGVAGEWVVPADAPAEPAVLYLHGGGYVAGSVDSHRGLVGHLARVMGCRVLVPEYRLAPEHRHPAALDDALAVYLALVADRDAGRVAVMGDSAGGGLTAALLVALRDGGHPLPAAAALISPWLDLTASGETMRTRAAVDPSVRPADVHEMASHYLGGLDPATPSASPLFAELAGLPPLLVQVGDAEVLLDDAVRFGERVEEAGGDVTVEVWPEMVHVWHASAGFVPESDAAIARIAEVVRPHLGLGLVRGRP